MFLEMNCVSLRNVTEWSFLPSHARVLLCIAHDPGARLRDIAAGLGITKRGAYVIVTDLTKAGYVVKQKRRPPQPLPDPGAPATAGAHQPEPAIGEVLAVLLGNKDGHAEPAGIAAAGRLSGGPADGAGIITARADGAGGTPGQRSSSPSGAGTGTIPLPAFRSLPVAGETPLRSQGMIYG
jgi:hypothetical protein